MLRVKKELDLRRLNNVFDWLWIAGRPMPPRPLHQQVLLSREIFVTEKMDMHLVWTTGRMFLKPIPRFLLEPRFWSCYLSCAHSCRCPKEDASSGEYIQKCEQNLWKCALGLLFSHAALITHESDYLIAKEKHLVPTEVTWPAWRTFVEQLDTEHIYPNINSRFVYGELRLSRLNKTYTLLQNPLRGYMSQWHQYGAFFQDNLAWLASAIVYITIVLTAIQVGLTTETLARNNVFQSVSYGLTVFSILGPLIVFGLIMVVFCYIFVMLSYCITTQVRVSQQHHSVNRLRTDLIGQTRARTWH
jgi:uncharacterized membrane protein